MITIGANAAPLARVSEATVRTQRTVPGVPVTDCSEQVHPVPAAETNDNPAGVAGRGSVTTKGPTAVSGPLLRTTRENVPVAPATKSPAVLSIATSAAWIRATAVAPFDR